MALQGLLAYEVPLNAVHVLHNAVGLLMLPSRKVRFVGFTCWNSHRESGTLIVVEDTLRSRILC